MRLPTEGVTSAPARGLVASRHAEPTATATVTTVKSLDPRIRTMRGPRCERSTETEAQVLDPRSACPTRVQDLRLRLGRTFTPRTAHGTNPGVETLHGRDRGCGGPRPGWRRLQPPGGGARPTLP